MSTYIEFDSLDEVLPQREVIENWRMLLTVEGGDRIVFHPGPELMKAVREEWERGDATDQATPPE